MTDDPIMRRLRAKYADLEQDGLFAAEPYQRGTGEATKQPRPKIYGYRPCGVCGKPNVAVLRVLGDDHRPHYVLRDHDRVTRRGHRFRCAGSGAQTGDTDAH